VLFHNGGGSTNTLRLAFSLYDPDELAEAARRLGGVIRDYGDAGEHRQGEGVTG
jgi:DNA-binding transcriptional MocR family regulator